MMTTTAVRRSQDRAPRSAPSRLVRPTSAVLCAALLAACAGSGGSARTGTRPHAAVAGTTSPPVSATTASPRATRSWAPREVPRGATLVATAKWRHVSVYDRGRTGVRWRLRNPNASGAPLVFGVVGQQPGWLEVRVPARPNQSLGWIRVRAVHLAVDRYRLAVSLSRHRLVVRRDGRHLLDLPVGVGRPTAPTPTGRFYLTELLQAPTATGPYGPYAYGTSAFSDVYSEFEGGPGQIGMHGTSDPSSIGASVSHGCVRLRNTDIAKLAHLVPVGTPITITR